MNRSCQPHWQVAIQPPNAEAAINILEGNGWTNERPGRIAKAHVLAHKEMRC